MVNARRGSCCGRDRNRHRRRAQSPCWRINRATRLRAHAMPGLPELRVYPWTAVALASLGVNRRTLAICSVQEAR